MLDRREFVALCAASPLAAQFQFSPLELDPDYQPAVPGMEYFFLGNGQILAAIQSVARAEAGTHAGLVLMPAERFGRKFTSLLYGIRSGLRHTRIGIAMDTGVFYPEAGTARITWHYPEGIPTVAIEWRAGEFAIEEALWCAATEPVLLRAVVVRNTGAAPLRARVVAALQPNTSVLDEYDVDRAGGVLTASGYHRVRLFASGGAVTTADRSLSIDTGAVAPGAEARVEVALTLDHPEKRPVVGRARTAAYWQSRATLATGHAGLDHLFRVALSGVRAAVAQSGKMDGGIWQYNLEWARDPVMVAQGAVAAGAEDVARAILERVWTHAVSDDGKTVALDRSRRRATLPRRLCPQELAMEPQHRRRPAHGLDRTPRRYRALGLGVRRNRPGRNRRRGRVPAPRGALELRHQIQGHGEVCQRRRNDHRRRLQGNSRRHQVDRR